MSLSEPKPTVPRPRIQGLSDLIFGLALSIGAAQQLVNPPQNSSDILNALVVFGFSFFILINVWLRYTSLTSVVPIETPSMVRLNVLLLFLVAIEPYLFNVLAKAGLSGSLGHDASAYYGLDIAGMNFVLAYFIHLTTMKGKKLIPDDLVDRFKRIRSYNVLVGLVFAFSAIPNFADVFIGGTSLRIVLWIATLPLIWISRALGRIGRAKKNLGA